MLKLDSDVNISDFFHWWGHELNALLPDSFRQFFVQEYQYLVAQPEADHIILTWVGTDKTKSIGRFDFNDEGKLSFQELLQNQPELKELNLILRLPSLDAVSKQIFLPTAAADNLQQVVVYELDKLTPFKPDQVYFAVKHNPQEQTLDHIKATLIVTPKAKLDNYYHKLSDWGKVPVLVDYQGLTNNINKRQNQYNLLPETYRVKKKRTEEFVIHSLCATLVILLFLAIATPVWMESQTVDKLTEQINAVEQDVKAIDGYKIEIDELYKEATVLIESKKNQPSALAMINTISQLIGDDTWLTYFKFNSGDLQVQGQSPNASSLIAYLEASPLFKQTHFVSPVTQDKKTGLERFQISAKVIRGDADE